MNTTLPSPALVANGDRLLTTRRAALAGMLGPALWILVLILLDTVQYDFLRSIGANPWTTAPASENGMGPYGWLYVASDFTLGGLTVLLALGLRRTIANSWWKTLGMTALLVFGLGFIIGSTPCDCLPGQQPTLSAQIHNIASLALLIATIPMSLLLGLAFRRDDRWRRYAWYSIMTGVLAPVLFFVVSALPPTFSWFYLWLLVIPFGWIELIALRLWQLTSEIAHQ